MKLSLVPQNFKISDKYKARVLSRYINSLDKYLHHLSEDLKNATLVITKNQRFGYQANFDMKLPFAHIFAKQQGKKLFTCLMSLRDLAKKQIKTHLGKIRSFKH